MLIAVDLKAVWSGKAEQCSNAAKAAPDVLVTPTPCQGLLTEHTLHWLPPSSLSSGQKKC